MPLRPSIGALWAIGLSAALMIPIWILMRAKEYGWPMVVIALSVIALIASRFR